MSGYADKMESIQEDMKESMLHAMNTASNPTTATATEKEAGVEACADDGLGSQQSACDEALLAAGVVDSVHSDVLLVVRFAISCCFESSRHSHCVLFAEENLRGGVHHHPKRRNLIICSCIAHSALFRNCTSGCSDGLAIITATVMIIIIVATRHISSMYYLFYSIRLL